MRLAQLARKLAVRPADITAYLAAQGISVNEGSNVRMEETHVRMAIMHFAPSELESILDNPSENDEDVAPLETREVVETPVVELKQPEVEEQISQPEEEIIFEPLDEEVKPEVIKAPKVELPGLKVVGKIELPEPKKKEPEPGEETGESVGDAQATEQTETRHKRKQFRERRKPDHPRRNSVALQREREARAAEKKKKEEEKREKERRTQHYLKKVKPSVPTKRASLFSEEVVEMTDEVGSEPPKTLWGKFIKWLRRE